MGRRAVKLTYENGVGVGGRKNQKAKGKRQKAKTKKQKPDF
jgi:hypothetical protein